MGLDVHVRVFFAARVFRSAFFARTGEKKRGCLVHPEHEVKEKDGFCSSCGAKTAFYEVESPTPTEKFKDACATHGLTAEEGFKTLLDGKWKAGHQSVGLHRINTWDSGDNDRPIYGLGFQLVKSESHRNPNGPDTLEVDTQDIEAQRTPLRAVMTLFGVASEPKIYVGTYLSY